MMETLQRFDGQAVDLYDAKFTGAFGTDGPASIDTEGYYVVRVRTKGAAVGETKSGDLKRTDNLSVLEGVKITDEEGLKLVTIHSAQGSLFDQDDDDDDDEI